MSRTKKDYLFIDGYNIINQWQYYREVKNIANSRNKLIELLIEYQAYRGLKVIVVFDAHLVKGSLEKEEQIDGIVVVYTKEHETADSYIEKQLDKIGRYEQVQVATSDGAIQQIVLARGGTRISAQEMIMKLENTKKDIRTKTEKPRQKGTNIDQIIDEETLNKLEKIRRSM
ncbi:MAG: NYN domain-containing protein [Sedimentibacter sp.]|uniref:NYN domain-containing protein n=1 Tax=Sedimentibacter sp. TaxID=1960295 RepID=UPI0029814545|nr:NYN domain-containing protein [Sedimentibacter sp.]MDW5300457.1 NYN domain-containing protein [Sedimentibacter sp.]